MATWEWGACARAMPIDTAVAAMISETASAMVANNSTPARRRLANVFWEIGDTKPTGTVSSVMTVILVAIFGESIAPNQLWPKRFCVAANIAPDLGEAIEEERQFREFWLMKD